MPPARRSALVESWDFREMVPPKSRMRTCSVNFTIISSSLFTHALHLDGRVIFNGEYLGSYTTAEDMAISAALMVRLARLLRNTHVAVSRQAIQCLMRTILSHTRTRPTSTLAVAQGIYIRPLKGESAHLIVGT
jgi:hypothetical protein